MIQYNGKTYGHLVVTLLGDGNVELELSNKGEAAKLVYIQVGHDVNQVVLAGTEDTSRYHHDAGGATRAPVSTIQGAVPPGVLPGDPATYPPRPADCTCPVSVRSIGQHLLACPLHPDYRPAA